MWLQRFWSVELEELSYFLLRWERLNKEKVWVRNLGVWTSQVTMLIRNSVQFASQFQYVFFDEQEKLSKHFSFKVSAC